MADSLIEEFRPPRHRQVATLSRGMRSSVGILVGLASRAPVTIFDEPYLGLDATAREQFYEVLLKEYAEVVVWSLFVVSIAATFALGAKICAIYARWGNAGLVVASPLVVVAGGGAAVLVTWRGWWGDVGTWFSAQTPLSSIGRCALLVLALTAATWGTLRRVRAS